MSPVLAVLKRVETGMGELNELVSLGKGGWKALCWLGALVITLIGVFGRPWEWWK